MRKLIIIVIVALFLFGCSNNNNEEQYGGEQSLQPSDFSLEGYVNEISFLTDDGVNIHGTYYRPKHAGSPAIILLHMLGWDRRGFQDLASRLRFEGYGVLAIDMRGHGESLINGKNWHSFNENDFNNMIYDVKAAKNYLEKDTKFVDPAKIGIIGTSIGANVAVKYASTYKDISTLILISPGLDYKGVKIENDITNYTGNLYIASATRDDYSYDSSLTLLSGASNANIRVIKTYISDSHGIHLIDRTSLRGRLFDYLEESFAG